MGESAIVGRVLQLIRAHGGVAEKTHGNEMTRVGVADVIACYRGAYLAIEVKQPGRVPTPAQERFLFEVRRAGGYGVWVDDDKVVARALGGQSWPNVCRRCLAGLVFTGGLRRCTADDTHGWIAGGNWFEPQRSV